MHTVFFGIGIVTSRLQFAIITAIRITFNVPMAPDTHITLCSNDLVQADAVLVPHAGWMYSGRLAAQTLKKVKIPPWVIIFAPQHRVGGEDWAVAPHQTWLLPGKNVEANIPMTDRMIQAVDFFAYDAKPHAQEHSIEVLLPILARRAPETKISAVAMTMSSWGMIQQGAAQFATFLNSLPTTTLQRPMLIISSDMNHFASEETTRRVDRLALDAIYRAAAELNPGHALRTVHEQRISMCGIIPAVFVMETLRMIDRLDRVIEVGYTTSAEASGDTSRVVGYAGLIFHSEM
jgi:AmmeMemoRadiSam system protein B